LTLFTPFYAFFKLKTIILFQKAHHKIHVICNKIRNCFLRLFSKDKPYLHLYFQRVFEWNLSSIFFFISLPPNEEVIYTNALECFLKIAFLHGPIVTLLFLLLFVLRFARINLKELLTTLNWQHLLLGHKHGIMLWLQTSR